MEFGALAHSSPPRVSVFYPNHKGALENPEGVEQVIDPELALGWMERSPHPPWVPVCIRPISIVPKTGQLVDGTFGTTGYRLITDASYPKKGKDSKVRDWDGLMKPIAPNSNYVADSQPEVVYTSIGEISIAAIPLLHAVACAQCSVVGRCWDFSKWFRQLYMNKMDQWQIVEAWQGQYLVDDRVTMGCVHSSNTAQRVSFILIEIVEGRLDGVFEERLAGCEGPQFELIRAWRERRKEAFPDDPKQWRIYHIKSYQDDTPTMVLDLFAEWFQSTMDGVFKELDVPLSSKGGGEFARAFEAIGGSFEFLDNGSLRVGPTRETEEDFAKDAKVVRDAFAEGSQVDGERFGTFLGAF